MKRVKQLSAEAIVKTFIEDVDKHILRKYDLLLGQLALYAPSGGKNLPDLQQAWTNTLNEQLKLRENRVITTKKLLDEIREVKANQAQGMMLKGGQ